MEKEITLCLDTLRRGGTLLYPTDTIWGIGCDATRAEAVERVYQIKQRAESKSMIILVADTEQIASYVQSVPPIALDLQKQVDKPLTIIYPGAKNLANNVIAADGSIAIRVVRHEFCQRLIRAFGKPIVSTSANISGEPAPAIFRNISKKIIDTVDHVVDESFGYLQELRASRIIRLLPDGQFEIIRP